MSEAWRAHTETLLSKEWKWRAELYTTALTTAFMFFAEHRVLPWTVPVSTGAISSPTGIGRDSLPVRVPLYGRSTYLADSVQFALELGLRMSGRDVFYLATSFRGEERDKFHLQEFQHIEAEMYGGLDDVIGLASKFVACLTRALSSASSWHHLTNGKAPAGLATVMAGSIPRVRHPEAIAMLRGEPGSIRTLETGLSVLTRHGEEQLCNLYDGAVWVTHLPWRSCPFYQRRSVDDRDSAEAADLLLGKCEVVGAGARCVTVEELEDSLRSQGNNGEDYGWYREMKRIAPLATAGFGMGLERYLMWVLSEADIQNCTPWVRHAAAAGYP